MRSWDGWLAALGCAASCLIGCAPGEPVQMRRPEAPPESAPASRHTLLFPGEHIEAKVDRAGFDLASLHVNFGSPCRTGDDLFVPVMAHAESAGFMAAVSSGELDSVSWLEHASGLPRFSEVRIDTDKTRAKLQLGFEPTGFSYRYRREGRPVRERSHALPEGALGHDVISALGATRALAAQGQGEATLHVVVGRRLWRIDIQHKGSENVTVGGEEHHASRLDGYAWRLMTESFKPARVPVELSMWLSDDVYRTPLRARVTKKDKTVEIDLVDYRLEPPPREPPPPCESLRGALRRDAQPRSQSRVDM
jgi:hypothetical protein